MISEEKKKQFVDLFGEFVREYLTQTRGQEHLRRYDESRVQGRINFEQIKEEMQRSNVVPTNKVLARLLPHTDSAAHRESGAWIHVASVIQGEIQNWFEASGWVQTEEWPEVAKEILNFIIESTDNPSAIDLACHNFSKSPHSNGLQTGILTPILNALRPDDFLIINNKSRRVINYFSGGSFKQRLTDYPSINVVGHTLIAELQDYMRDASKSDARPDDLFDTFCHWLIAEKKSKLDSDSTPPEFEDEHLASRRIWLYAPGRNAMYWDEFQSAGIAGIGWDYVGDLSSFKDPTSIKARMDELSSEPESLVNASQCFDFSHRMNQGDWIFVKKGRRQIIGFGIVNSEYRFESGRSFFNNIRDVAWKKTGSWPTASHRLLPMKTITEITDEALIDELEQLVGISEPSLAAPPITKPLSIYTIEDFSAESAITQETIALWLRRLKRKQHLILQGPPGTGKTFIAERLARLLTSNTSGFIETVQFHPSYGYEDFMHGIRPMIDDGKNLVFARMPGRFKQFCTRAQTLKDNSPCVLIIDEINRANLSRVFGELMYLLEYRDKKIPLAGEDSQFSIPPNVYLIGTMNTADRSIALVDHALRRRFSFIYIPPDYEVLRKHLEKHGLSADDLIKALRAVNIAIGDRNYEIGISFFLKDGGALRSTLKDVWEGEIEPYLEEYFNDQPAALEPLRWEYLSSSVLASWNKST